MDAEGPTVDGGADRDPPLGGLTAEALLRRSYRLGNSSRPGGCPGDPNRSRSVASHWRSACPLSVLVKDTALRRGFALDTDGKVGCELDPQYEPPAMGRRAAPLGRTKGMLEQHY